MSESNRRVIQFLEKEIKTYQALARFLSKEGLLKEAGRKGSSEMLMTPAFYNERMKEVRILVSDLRK